MSGVFDHEKLHAYQAALEFVRFVNELLRGIPTEHRNAKDQLLRASQSIPLNIAEGNAKTSYRDRIRFFEIARGSAMECAAALDILVVCEGCTSNDVAPGREVLVRVISMVTRMCDIGSRTAREQTADYDYDDDYDYEKRRQQKET